MDRADGDTRPRHTYVGRKSRATITIVDDPPQPRAAASPRILRFFLYTSWPVMFLGAWVALQTGWIEFGAAACGVGVVMMTVGFLGGFILLGADALRRGP